MATQLDLPVFWKGIKKYRSSAPLIGATALLLVGAGVIFALPRGDTQPGNASVATATVNTTAASAETTGSSNASSDTELDDSACSRQAWPYVDQRCAQRVEKARDSRKVRIVTDKGNSVTVMTPVPVVEAKPKPAPAPVVAQAERKIGPAATPPAPEGAPPVETTASVAKPEKPATPPQAAKTETAAALQHTPAPEAPKPVVSEVKPSVQTAMATDNQPAAGETRTRNPVEPVASSQAPAPSFIESIERSRQKLEKSERLQKREAKREAKEAKREAKRRKMMEDAGAPDEVVAAVKGSKNGRRYSQAVPDEVIAAVEQATARDQSASSFGRDRRGRVVYIERGW